MLTKGKVRSLLNYDKQNGQFIWLDSKNNQIKKGDQAGYIDDQGYRRICIEGIEYRAHRLAWLYVFGFMPEMIDHINGIRSDNRLSNLRECTSSQNAINRKIQSNNKSGVPGVHWNKREGKWKAYAKIKGKIINLGTHVNKEEAINARLEFCKKEYGEFYPQCNHRQTY